MLRGFQEWRPIKVSFYFEKKIYFIFLLLEHWCVDINSTKIVLTIGYPLKARALYAELTYLDLKINNFNDFFYNIEVDCFFYIMT